MKINRNLKHFIKIKAETLFPHFVYPKEYRIIDKIIKKRIIPKGFIDYELLFFIDYFSPNSIILDIGCNLGVYTHCFSTFGNNYHIYAFEPIPELYKRLKKLYNKKAKIFQYAISDTIGTAELKIPYLQNIEYQTRATLSVKFKENLENKARFIQVQTQTIDNFCKKEKINKVDFIKIDVEGYEEFVIEGARNILESSKPVVLMECEQIHHPDKSVTSIIKKILNRGFNCCYMDAEDMIIKDITHFFKFPSNQKSYKNSRTNNMFIFYDKSVHKNLPNLLQLRLNIFLKN